MSRDPKEDLGIKVHSYLNNLADILRDNEFIKLLLREYINLKLMIDKGKSSFKDVTIYALYIYDYLIVYSQIRDFVFFNRFYIFLRKKLGKPSKIREVGNEDLVDVSNIELLDKIYARILTTFSET